MIHILCDVASLRARDARSLDVQTPNGSVEVVVVKWRGEVYLYRNACPHTGVSLNWLPDQFWSVEGDHLQCSTHGAQFRPEDGRCVWGPCLGQALEALPRVIEGGMVCWVQGLEG